MFWLLEECFCNCNVGTLNPGRIKTLKEDQAVSWSCCAVGFVDLEGGVGLPAVAAGSDAQKKADGIRQEAMQKLQACLNEDGAIKNSEAAGLPPFPLM